jgi:DNA-binding NarL/FixJ family response regulator
VTGLVVVEDDPDIQSLIQAVFRADRRFSFDGAAESAEEGIEVARAARPALIVLDHGLTGVMTGLQAAPMFKDAAPRAKIILFTAHAELERSADDEPAIDAFLLKTNVRQLLVLAQEITGMGPSTH